RHRRPAKRGCGREEEDGEAEEEEAEHGPLAPHTGGGSTGNLCSLVPHLAAALRWPAPVGASPIDAPWLATAGWARRCARCRRFRSRFRGNLPSRIRRPAVHGRNRMAFYYVEFSSTLSASRNAYRQTRPLAGADDAVRMRCPAENMVPHRDRG